MTTSRLRLRFDKKGKIRFTSHRDVARIWERAVRKAGLPVAYSQGFSPRARLSFGLALSTGYESDAEYLDVDLDGALSHEPSDLIGMLSTCLPVGMSALAAAELPTGSRSLQQLVTECGYVLDLVPDRLAPASETVDFASRVEEGIAALGAATEVVVQRSRKGSVVTEDIRPGVLALAFIDAPASSDDGAPAVRVRAELSAQPSAVRPADVLRALADAGAPPLAARVRRTHQWIQLDGLRTEPLTADSSAAAAVMASSPAGASSAAGDRSAGALLPAAPPIWAPAPREEHVDVRFRRFRAPAVSGGLGA